MFFAQSLDRRDDSLAAQVREFLPRRVFDIHACPGNLNRLAPAGFEVEHHELTLYGRCPDCKQGS